MGITSDGSRVVFASDASNLVTNNHNGFVDIFVRDRTVPRTMLVSVNATGQSSANASSTAPVLSADGRFVAFQSAATDLTPRDSNGLDDVFLRDLTAATTWLVSVNRDGTGSGNGVSGHPAVSANGSWVAFESLASDLVENDTNNVSDIFARDIVRGETLRVSVEVPGIPLRDAPAINPRITPDGRFVVFLRQINARAPSGVGYNYGSEVLVRDLQAGVTYWASTNAAQFFPAPAVVVAYNPALSADGRYVAFKIASSNSVLVVRHELQSARTELISSNNVGTPQFYRNVLSYSDFSGPQISADGQSVGYTTAGITKYSADNQVYVWDGLAGTNRCASLNQAGAAPGNHYSGAPALSADGRTVVFESMASDLVTNPASGGMQIYARDLAAGRTKLITVDPLGAASAPGDSGMPILSGDGRWVALDTIDRHLVSNNASQFQNAYLRDLAADTTELVSRSDPSLAGITAGAASTRAVNGVSADGRFVVFSSLAGDEDNFDTRGLFQVYRRDLLKGITELVSGNLSGAGGGNGNSITPVISAEGRWVAFASDASDLVDKDANHALDVFVRDLNSGVTTLLSENYNHTGPGNSWSDSPWISPDARFVIFRSQATNLLPSPAGFGPLWYLRDLISGSTTLISAYTNPPVLPRLAGTLTGVSVPLHLAIFGETASPRRIYTYNLITGGISLLVTNAGQPTVSVNGRWLAYNPGLNPANLVLRDLDTGTNLTLTLPYPAANLSLSADGQIVAYEAAAPTQSVHQQVYVYEVRRGTNRLISVARSDNAGGSGDSRYPQVSPDGRYVIFKSHADDLVANDTNGLSDIFVRDLVADTTFCLSTNQAGTGPGNSLSGNASLGRDGRTVVFESFATDLVAGDDNACRDVFLVPLPFSDLDRDGMDDAWEIQTFGGLAHDGQGDTDGDGMSDRQEYLAGTDPANPHSNLRLHPPVVSSEGRVTLTWNAVAGKTYRVQFTDRLLDASWRDLPAGAQALGDVGSQVDDTIDRARERYYRLIVRPEN